MWSFLLGNNKISGIIQVGSKVRVKKSVTKPKHGWGNPGMNHEIVGTVKSIENGDLRIDFPVQSLWHGIMDEMELA